MLIKLRRKFFNNQRLVLIILCFVFIYIVLCPKEFYTRTNFIESINGNRQTRKFLINFLTNLEFTDLINQNNSNRLLIKNLNVQDTQTIDYDDDQNANKLISLNDFDDFKLVSQGLNDLKVLNLKNLSLDNFNLIKKNLNKFATADLLSFVIQFKNYQQFILNLDRFKTKNLETVIVVQVHERIHYLKLLIQSLSEVKGIENVLLIFSHDLFDLQINSLIEDIEFCKVIQIYYPYSIQIFHNQFPGPNPLDCSRDISYFFAKLINCNNANYPDKFGHYREAKFVQTKHHWWWKINYIFDKLNITKQFDGLLLTLEEDHYVLPDLLYIMKFLHTQNRKNNRLELISMGSYVQSLKNLINYNNLAVNREWNSFKHNIGMVLTRTLFNEKIKKYSKQFCTHDDYNWDWSLQYISKTCLATPLRTTNLLFPRVLHIGECGLHRHKKNCENLTLINEFNTLIKTSDLLFPKKLKIQTLSNEKINRKKPNVINGGFADIRDHELCLNFTNT